MGLASTAPVYSLVATLGFVIAEVGAQAPIAFILAFVPMFFIAFAYRELNRAVPDCGTTFTWTTKAFGPWVGWLGGWGVAVAGIIVLGNLAQIAGLYFWYLIGPLVGVPELADNRWLVLGTGVFFILAMVYVSYRGVEIGERLQNILLGIQYLALVLFVIFAVVGFTNGTAMEATPVSGDWFNPFGFTDFDSFTAAILLAIFIYWGWDTCLALNEETKDPKRIPGRAALISTLVLVVTYVGVTVAAIAYAGLDNLVDQDDVFLVVKDALFGPWAWLLVLAVMISAISSTQTTILPTARGTLVDGDLQGAAEAVRHGAPDVPHPGLLDSRDGRRGDGVLRRDDADQRELLRRLDLLARPRDRVLLRPHRVRVRLVFPSRTVHERPQLLLQVPVPAARRSDPDRSVS